MAGGKEKNDPSPFMSEYFYNSYCLYSIVNSNSVMFILSVDSVSCSKKRKLQAVQEYWTAKSEQYYSQSDDASKTDSQDSLDHQC